MRDIKLSDDTAAIRALLDLLRSHPRARVWIQSLIAEDHWGAFASALRDGDPSTLTSLGVGAVVSRELRERDSPQDKDRAYGGLSECQVLLLMRTFSGRQPRVSLSDLLLLRLWSVIVARGESALVPLPVASATLAMWGRTIANRGGHGLERLGAALRLLERARDGKRQVDQEWRLDVLRYMLDHPKPRYTIAELLRAIPNRYAPRDRKDLLNFCRKHQIAAGRPAASEA